MSAPDEAGRSVVSRVIADWRAMNRQTRALWFALGYIAATVVTLVMLGLKG